MTIKPLVRHMLLCDDWHVNPANRHGLNIIGLITNIDALDDPPYPLVHQELCAFLTLTEGRGMGDGKIVCVFEENDQRVFETPVRSIQFGADPLEVLGVCFRIRDCPFPRAGLYSVQFWFDSEIIEERPLRMR